MLVGTDGARQGFADSVRQPLLARSGLILGFETRNQLEERGGKISIAAHCVCRFATERTNDDALTTGLCFVIRPIMRFHSVARSIGRCIWGTGSCNKCVLDPPSSSFTVPFQANCKNSA